MSYQERAEYFRERRKNLKQFSVMVDRKILDQLDEKLLEYGKTRSEWLREKISEELGKKK